MLIDQDHHLARIRVGDRVEIGHFVVVAVLIADEHLPRAHELAGDSLAHEE
jgi:hypothetical protein